MTYELWDRESANIVMATSDLSELATFAFKYGQANPAATDIDLTVQARNPMTTDEPGPSAKPLTPDEEAELRRRAERPDTGGDWTLPTLRKLLATLDATRDAYDTYRDEHNGWCAKDLAALQGDADAPPRKTITLADSEPDSYDDLSDWGDADAPVGGLDVELLARALWAALPENYIGVPGMDADHARAIAAEYDRLAAARLPVPE